MKKTLVVTVGAWALAAASVAQLGAAERKTPKAIDLDALIKETQRSATSTGGMNVVWVIPVEFWRVSATREGVLNEAQIRQISSALEKYLIVGVVRADISPLGSFKFHDEKSVLANMRVTYVDEKGVQQAFQLPKTIDDDAKLIIKAIKPVLSAAMGNLGDNFHLFVFEDRDQFGKRIASPYEPGVLRVELKEHRQEKGGTVEFPFPLDSLHVPRECGKCSKKAHISWSYCPWCGTKHQQ